MRHPVHPLAFRLLHISRSLSGVVAGIIVLRTFPPQCLQFKLQDFPVMDIEGKAVIEDLK